MKRLARALLPAAILAGCGSSSSGPPVGTGTSSGTVEGQSLAVKDATFVEDMGGNPAAFFERVTIYVRDAPRACVPVPSTTQLVLYAQGDFVGTGTYALGQSAGATVSRGVLQALDDQCQSRVMPMNELATGGSWTITSKTDTEIDGSFDAVFPGGELKGTFSAQAFDCATADAGSPPSACP